MKPENRGRGELRAMEEGWTVEMKDREEEKGKEEGRGREDKKEREKAIKRVK